MKKRIISVLAALVMVVLFIMNRLHVYAIAPYLLVGVALWYCVLSSGV
ncbi:MAG: Na+/H+ antiporter NhaA, partial [Clostridia bacterium]|nr:Na+/H+ antiporter NhaA [Clostridia bacterium]